MKSTIYLLAIVALTCICSSVGAQQLVLDNSFGTSGKFSKHISGKKITPFGARGQANGKTLLCGNWVSLSGSQDSGALYRLNNDGKLDTTFANHGYFSKNMSGTLDAICDIAELSDRRIVVLAYDKTTTERFHIFMLDSNGTQDMSFGSGGEVLYSAPDKNYEFFYLKKQSNDKFLVSGGLFDTSFSSGSASIMRFNTNGTLDTTFGTHGAYSYAPAGLFLSFDEISVDAADTIYFPITDATNYGTYTAFCVAKLTPNGNLVTGYGHSGISDTARDVLLYGRPVLFPGGKVIFCTGWGTSFPTLTFYTYALNSMGLKDATYGTAGTNSFPVTGFDQNTFWYTIENGNKLICLFDQASTTVTGQRDIVIIQIDSVGNQDASWGTGGQIRIPAGNAQVGGWAFKRPDGTIIIEAGQDTTAGVAFRLKPHSGLSVNAIGSRIEGPRIFPNPAISFISVESATKVSYNILNLAGKRMNSGFVQNNEKIDISNIPAGVYILETTTQSGTFSNKFIKE